MFTFTSEEIVHMLAHIHDDRGPILIGVTCMFLVLCITATSARFLARRITRAALAADDYLVLTALVRERERSLAGSFGDQANPMIF